MTPQEKANELYYLYYTPLLKYKGAINIKNTIELYKCAKKCALVTVDEILEECLQLKVEFWEDVKIEIEKL